MRIVRPVEFKLEHFFPNTFLELLTYEHSSVLFLLIYVYLARWEEYIDTSLPKS